MNDLFSDVFIFGPIGAIIRINKRNHLKHHKHLSTVNDPDRYKQTCLGKETKNGLFMFLLGIQTFIQTVSNVMLNKGSNKERIPETKYKIRDIIILLGWQLVLIGGLTYFIGWWAYPLLWVTPFYLFCFLMDNFRTFAEHSHPESDSKADSHRLITYLPNSIEKFFFAPMNMHFHAVHHLWISIPYYNLEIADAELRKAKGSEELIWRYSYIDHLRNWIHQTPIKECGDDK